MQRSKKQDTTGKDVKGKIHKIIKFLAFISQFVFLLIGFITGSSICFFLAMLMSVVYLAMMSLDEIDERYKIAEARSNEQMAILMRLHHWNRKRFDQDTFTSNKMGEFINEIMDAIQDE